MRARVATPLLVIVCSVGVMSCTSDRSIPIEAADELDELATPVLPTLFWPFVPTSDFGPAIVTGCWRSDELGNVNGSWGKPSGGRPYPNPTNGYVICPFALAKDCEIIWWLEKAYGPGEQPPEGSGQYGGGTMIEPSVVLLGPSTEFQAAGIHAIGWDGRDRSGGQVPAGYYRMYARLPGVGLMGWWDILIERD